VILPERFLSSEICHSLFIFIMCVLLITDFRGRLSAYDFRQNLASFPARSSSSHYTN
jgi:hypothetical protein